NEWDHISIPWISEYLNYAELGAVLTGHHHSEQGTPVYGFCAQHHELRWGQDVILAAVAQITVRHPLQAIIPLAVLFRFQYAIGLGLIVCAMVPARNWKWAAAVLALDAILLTELLSFSCSFFSSNCTAPLFMIYLVWLARLQAFHVREALVVVLMNLFFLLTYTEFLIVAKAFEAMSFFLALRRGKRWHWAPLTACNLAVLAMHPLLVFGRASYLWAHLAQPIGWNVIGDPFNEFAHFLGNIVGLRYGNLALDPLEEYGFVLWPLALVIFATALAGAVLLARRY